MPKITIIDPQDGGRVAKEYTELIAITGITLGSLYDFRSVPTEARLEISCEDDSRVIIYNRKAIIHL